MAYLYTFTFLKLIFPFLLVIFGGNKLPIVASVFSQSSYAATFNCVLFYPLTSRRWMILSKLAGDLWIHRGRIGFWHNGLFLNTIFCWVVVLAVTHSPDLLRHNSPVYRCFTSVRRSTLTHHVGASDAPGSHLFYYVARFTAYLVVRSLSLHETNGKQTP